MITKNDLVLAAYNELMISGITSNPNPEEIVIAIRRMDNMVLAWKNKGVCLSYLRSEGFNDINPSQDSGLNDTSALAVILNLAKELCPAFGKPCHPQTMTGAKEAYDNLFSVELTMRETDPYQPTGSGHSFGYGYDDRFRFQAKESNAPEDCYTKDIKVGQIDSYGLDFTPYLNEVAGDYILSFTVEDGQGVEVINSAESDGVVTIEAKGLTIGFAPVKITVTTFKGRVLPENINFNVT